MQEKQDQKGGFCENNSNVPNTTTTTTTTYSPKPKPIPKPKKLLSFVDDEDEPAFYHSFSKQTLSSFHNISSLGDYPCSTTTITTTSFSNDDVHVIVSDLFHHWVNSVELHIEHVGVGQARDFVQNAVVWFEQHVI